MRSESCVRIQAMWRRVTPPGLNIAGPRVHQLQDGAKGRRSFKLFEVDVNAERLSDKAEEGYLRDGVPPGNAIMAGGRDLISAQVRKNPLETVH